MTEEQAIPIPEGWAIISLPEDDWVCPYCGGALDYQLGVKEHTVIVYCLDDACNFQELLLLDEQLKRRLGIISAVWFTGGAKA